MPKTDSYDLFFEYNPIPMWIYDKQTFMLLAVNQSAEKLYGYSKKEFLQKSLPDIILKDHYNENEPNYEAHNTASGNILRIKVLNSEITYKDKSGILSVLIDVTLKSQIRRDLLESEKKFRQIVDSAMDAIITINSKHEIILFNKSAEQMFGYSAADVIGKDLNILIPSRFARQHHKHISDFGHTGTTNREMGTLGTIYGINSNGIEFPIEASISQILHRNEKLFTVILRNISERLEAEEIKEKFQHLAENLTDVFYVTDPASNKIIYLSPSFKDMYERDPDDLYQQKLNWLDLVHPGDLERIKKHAEQQQNDGNSFNDEFRILTPSGKIKWIASKASYIRDVNGTLVRIAGIATDITIKKEKEYELKKLLSKERESSRNAEAARKKLEFLADASELLSSSLDYHDILKSVAQLATPKFSDWCVVDILDEAGELNRLAVSHINPDKVKLAIELHQKYGPSKDEKTGVYHVVRTGVSELYPEIPEELIRDSARDEDHLRISLELGLRSAMIVPLKARDQVFGAITLIYAESERRYDASDLQLIEDLARRAAIAIDNAKLFARAQNLNNELDNKIKDLEIEISGRMHIESILLENQEKLIQSEERLKAALNASETGTYRWNRANNIMDFDEGLLTLFGLPNDSQLTYESFLQCVHPEERDALTHEHAKSMKENRDFEFEYRVVWNDDSIHWLLDKGKFFVDDSGDAQYLTGACVDITYRKNAEHTLRESEILFRQLAENIRDVFFIINPKNSNIIYISPVFEDVWGFNREDIYRNPKLYLDSLHPQDKEYFKEIVQKALVTGKYTAEFRIIRSDNTIRWLRSRGFPLYNDKQELYRIAGITEDITERKLAEEELHKSQEFLRRTVTSAPIVLWAVNNDCQITLLEGRGLGNIGAESENFLGKNIFEFFKDTREFRMYLSNAFKGEESSFIIAEKGSWQEVRFSPLKDNAGNIQGVIGVAVDITQHKEAEEKIMNSLKEKDVLLKEIHHRVKNNLQIISSILSLQSGYIEDELIQNIFEESKNRVRSMALLHEKLYQTKDFTKIDFKGYIKDLVLNLFRSYQIERERIKLEINGEEINIDAEKAISIGLIINELISNSLKYAFKGIEDGKIIISFDRFQENSLMINIADNGVGLPENFKLNSTDTLGLQLISSLVEQLEGTIRVFNHTGANFEITLPDITQG